MKCCDLVLIFVQNLWDIIIIISIMVIYFKLFTPFIGTESAPQKLIFFFFFTFFMLISTIEKILHLI